MSKRMEFLKVTGGDDWKTLDGLVADLDRAGYWKGMRERSPVEKRRHVRKMLAMLVFREAATGSKASGGPSLGKRHVFVSTIKAGDSGELVRVYKQFFDLTDRELRDLLEDEGASRAYRAKRAEQGKAFVKSYLEGDREADGLVLEELTGETMRRAWPNMSPVERRRIALAALIQHRRSEEALSQISEWCRQEGFDIERLMDEYLSAAGVSSVVDPQEASEIAESATEYFKVVDELGGLNFGKMCFKTLMDARASTIDEFAEREGIDPEEATALFAGELGEYAEEFQGVLEAYRRDAFGWTLDEHLQFAIERRGEQGG